MNNKAKLDQAGRVIDQMPASIDIIPNTHQGLFYGGIYGSILWIADLDNDVSMKPIPSSIMSTKDH